MILLLMMKPHVSRASTEYVSGNAEKKETQAYKYVKEISERYISYRDLDPWLERINKNRAALDYGSGLGFSTAFLANHGFTVQGVDISQSMIAEAKNTYPNLNFNLITKNKLPFKDETFDLVFSGFVLLELATKSEIQAYIAEAKRVLKKDGYFIGVTSSQHAHDPEYKSNLYVTDFPENKNATSGSQVRIHLKEIDLTFMNYVWFENDYREIFASAGLPICSVHYPLGKDGEGYPWLDEMVKPWVILILAAKSCS